MAADTNYRLLPCSELANILKTKGITYSNKKKEDLIHLCESAEALNLPDVEKCVDSVETRTSLSRRTVDGKTYPHPLFESILTWNNNLRSVPSVDAYDVTCFLVKYCGWSDERVKRRKSDNSWQLHCSGHIHDVKMSMLEPDLCYLLGKCVPETKQSSQPYTPWVLVKKSGQILSAECTCVAGDGSCKHVAALLFGIVDLVLSIEDRSSIGVTDTAAYWDKPRKVCRPIDVHNLDIRTDAVKNEKARASEESGYLPLKPDLLDKKRMEKDIIKVLKDSNTPGVGLYTLSDSEDESDEDMSFFVENYPLNVSDLITNHGVENVSSKITDSYISEVNDLTKGQSANTMWQYQRKGRLTASNFYSASHYRGDSIDNYIVKQVLGLSQFTSEATKHGKTQEPIARTKYTDLMLKHHPSFQCDETGLFVYKDYPFLAASPDGVVKCKCCAKGLVEIKCPYTFHNESPQVAMSKSPSCVMGDGGYELKKTLSSPYYVQMLGQMGVTNSPYCDFVLYTQKYLYVERVEFNAQHWEILSEKLKNFYIQFVLPHLV